MRPRHRVGPMAEVPKDRLLTRRPATAGANPKVDKIFESFDKPTSPGCSLAAMRDGQIV